MAPRLTHIALHVDALDACIDFYQRYCGLQVADDRVRGGRRVVLMAEAGRESDFVLQLLGGGEDRPVDPSTRRWRRVARRASSYSSPRTGPSRSVTSSASRTPTAIRSRSATAT
jgi:catechol 2,3-dioxygenase-like lactoylglutathione lyase family enzyme